MSKIVDRSKFVDSLGIWGLGAEMIHVCTISREVHHLHLRQSPRFWPICTCPLTQSSPRRGPLELKNGRWSGRRVALPIAYAMLRCWVGSSIFSLFWLIPPLLQSNTGLNNQESIEVRYSKSSMYVLKLITDVKFTTQVLNDLQHFKQPYPHMKMHD